MHQATTTGLVEPAELAGEGGQPLGRLADGVRPVYAGRGDRAGQVRGQVFPGHRDVDRGQRLGQGVLYNMLVKQQRSGRRVGRDFRLSTA